MGRWATCGIALALVGCTAADVAGTPRPDIGRTAASPRGHADAAPEADTHLDAKADANESDAEASDALAEAAAVSCTAGAPPAPGEECKVGTYDKQGPCFATKTAACECIGCPLQACKHKPPLCLGFCYPDGGCVTPACTVYCTDAGAGDAGAD